MRSPLIDDLVSSYGPRGRAIAQELRGIIATTPTDVVERVKWNSASFSINGEDRVLIGIARNGEVRVVLHRGAIVKDASAFHFRDDAGLAYWLAPDRGIIHFGSLGAVDEHRAALFDLFRRWLNRS